MQTAFDAKDTIKLIVASKFLLKDSERQRLAWDDLKCQCSRTTDGVSKGKTGPQFFCALMFRYPVLDDIQAFYFTVLACL